MGASPGAERTLDELTAAWNSHDVDAILRCFTDDCVYEDVAFEIEMHGKDGVRAFAEQLFATIPDFEYRPTSRVVGDGAAAVEYVLTGTPERDLAGNVVEPYQLTKRGATFIVLEGDKIARHSDYVDSGGVKA